MVRGGYGPGRAGETGSAAIPGPAATCRASASGGTSNASGSAGNSAVWWSAAAAGRASQPLDADPAPGSVACRPQPRLSAGTAAGEIGSPVAAGRRGTDGVAANSP